MRASILKRLFMPQKELEAYHRAMRAEDFRLGRDVRGLRWRRVCHPLVLALLRCSGFFAGQRLTILGDRRGAVSGPCVYACTHVGRYDIEMALRTSAGSAGFSWGIRAGATGIWMGWCCG